jgi:hypothetical protein
VLEESADKTRMFWTLLKDQALSYFEHHLTRRMEAEESDAPDNGIKETVLKCTNLSMARIYSNHLNRKSNFQGATCCRNEK